MQTHVASLTVLAVVALVPHDGAVSAGSACQTGPQFFDYGSHREDPEAEHLAMNLTGELRAPDAEYDRIRRDLAAIRAAYPFLETVVDDPDYRPDGLTVIANLPSPGFDQLNQFYQVVNIHTVFDDIHFLTFCDNINAPVLEPIYETVPEVGNAQPDQAGGDDQILITVLGSTMRYDIDDGFGDCPAGCSCHTRWVIDVDQAGVVTLVSFDQLESPGCDYPEPACCAAGGTCDNRLIGSCLQQNGVPLIPSVACDGDSDQDGTDAACGDNCPQTANPGFADADQDGLGDACDNCIYGPNPAQGPAPFGQVIRAQNTDTFTWATPADVSWVRGDLAGVGSYTVDFVDSLPPSTAVVDLLLPSFGDGFYYLFKPSCAVGSWQTDPGSEPGRDALLP